MIEVEKDIWMRKNDVDPVRYLKANQVITVMWMPYAIVCADVRSWQ